MTIYDLIQFMCVRYYVEDIKINVFFIKGVLVNIQKYWVLSVSSETSSLIILNIKYGHY